MSEEKTSVLWGMKDSDEMCPSEVRINSNNDDENTEGSLDWFNWASIKFDKQGNEISFHLSTGDPRGSSYSVTIGKNDGKIQTKSSSRLNNSNETIMVGAFFFSFPFESPCLF